MSFAFSIIFLCSCGTLYAEEAKPPQEPIPPVNIEKTKEPEATGEAAPREAEPETGAVDTRAQGTSDKMGKPMTPKKLEMDTNYDGRVDRIEIYDSEGSIQRLDLDTNGDGNFDEWMIFENGKPRMKGKDRNEDGRTDTWIEY
jgi:hypothetical protein